MKSLKYITCYLICLLVFTSSYAAFASAEIAKEIEEKKKQEQQDKADKADNSESEVPTEETDDETSCLTSGSIYDAVIPGADFHFNHDYNFTSPTLLLFAYSHYTFNPDLSRSRTYYDKLFSSSILINAP